MANLIERAGKKAAALLLGSLEKWVQGMIVLLLTSLSTALVLYFKEAWHPRLFYALLGATIALVVSTAFPLTIVVVKAIQERRSGKPDKAALKQLDRLAIADKSNIKDLVMVCIVSCRTEINQGDPHVNFSFHLLNMYLYPISVESVRGSIRYSQSLNPARERILLRLPIGLNDTDNLAQNIPLRQTGSFTVCQPLTKQNADYIEAMEGLFWLNDLIITVKGDKFDSVVIPTSTIYVQKDREWQASNPESYFIYRDAVRAEAKFQELEAERDALKELVEEQPQKALPETFEKK